MSERKDEQWLDKQLRRVINGAPPVFDAESWQRRYDREFQTLMARGGRPADVPARGDVCATPWILKLMGKLALAAAILVTAGILLVGRLGQSPDRPIPEPSAVDLPSPARMVSMMSFSAAFRRGGLDELDRHSERALETLGPRPNEVSVQELLEDIVAMNGKG
ncbi:MAG: hypothetical protein FJ280_20545 [Planctomycetes bacterium]|nr:hypothetical protein [Planctomycetota bacterium]